MTYTIVIDTAADLLAACVPDGDDQARSLELLEYHSQCATDHVPELLAFAGLTLTDEEPENEERVVWRGHDRGWLSDADGTTFRYAIRI